MSSRSIRNTLNGLNSNWPSLAIFGLLSILTPLSIIYFVSVIVPYFGRKAIILLVYLYTAIFVVFNISKTMDGDFVWYAGQYVLFAHMPLSVVFQEPVIGIQAAYSEPIYHVIAFCLSRITNGNIYALTITTTVIIYAVAAHAIIRIGEHYLVDYRIIGDVMLFFILGGITFTLTNHLIRQYLAMSVALLAVSFAIEKNFLKAALLATVAVATHNMTIVYCAIAIGSVIIIPRLKLRRVSGLLLAAVVGVACAQVIPFLSGSIEKLSTEELFFTDDGSVSYVVRTGDFCLWLTTIVIFIGDNKQCRCHNGTLYAMVLLYTSIYWFIIAIGYSPLLSLRFYFMLDYVRWCSMFVLANTAIWGALRGYATALLVAVGLAYCEARMIVSPFVYKIDFLDLATGIFRQE